MKKAYPTFIAKHKADYIVYVPDLDAYTQGTGMENAIDMARDVIGLTCIDWETAGKKIPDASDYEQAIEKAKRNTDDFDYTTGILTLVDVDIEAFRRKVMNQSVKKNCTIPYWLSVKADEAGVNFSKVLQEALCQKLKL